MGFKEGGGKKLCPHYFDGITLYGFEGEYVFKKIKKANDFYESHLLKRWEKYILPNSIIYDVGANLGNHTVYFSKRTPAKKVYSFEPVQMNYELLTKNCKENECSNVETFNFAIGAKKCKAIMKINEANFGNSKALMNDDGNIEVYPLDDLNLEIPDFVKIDRRL